MEMKHDETLEGLYKAAILHLETLLDPQKAYIEETGTAISLDNSLLRLKLWGKEVGQETGSLALMEEKYPDEAATLHHHLSTVLLRLEELGQAESEDEFLAFSPTE
jgi:hypothetical protein